MRGYAYAKVYGALERRGIDALIPTKAEPIRSPVPLRRFRYDAQNDIVKCPRGKILRPGNPVAHGRFFYARKRDCDRCALASVCLSKGRTSKGLVISHDYPALISASTPAKAVSWLKARHGNLPGAHRGTSATPLPMPDQPTRPPFMVRANQDRRLLTG